MFDTRALNLDKLNSLTKYPSILTYHKIDPKNGSLLDEILTPLAGELIGTEKVDGTNGRIITFPDGMAIVGSREELLWATGDLLFNPKEGIVDSLRVIANALADLGRLYDIVRVYYVEVYGGTVNGSGKAWKNYTGNKIPGYRLFDCTDYTIDAFNEYLTWPVEKFSGWRERGGQPFYTEEQLHTLPLTLVPRIPLTDIPTKFDDMLPWLQKVCGQTACGLDEKALGKPEGIVVRSKDRKVICKIRYEDYERTLRRRAAQNG